MWTYLAGIEMMVDFKLLKIHLGLNYIETCGGFIKTIPYKEAFRIAWDKASKEEHEKLLKLPNWNNEIFKEITGIDAEDEIAKE